MCNDRSGKLRLLALAVIASTCLWQGCEVTHGTTTLLTCSYKRWVWCPECHEEFTWDHSGKTYTDSLKGHIVITSKGALQDEYQTVLHVCPKDNAALAVIVGHSSGTRIYLPSSSGVYAKRIYCPVCRRRFSGDHLQKTYTNSIKVDAVVSENDFWGRQEIILYVCPDDNAVAAVTVEHNNHIRLCNPALEEVFSTARR